MGLSGTGLSGSMDFQLQPVTEPGRRFVELCEKHASDFATRAEQHDREGSFPMTSATPAEGGWLLNGRKIFGTNSPIASIVSVFARLEGDDGSFESVFAFVPRDAPGFEIRDNWDAMGMRASGSNDLVFTDCFVPEGMLLPIGPWGVLNPFWLAFYVAGNMGLLGAFLGIAEAARDAIVGLVTTRRKAPSNRLLAGRSPIQHTVAEIEIDLVAARAMLERTAHRADGYFDAHRPTQMAASGGAGYLSANPISRFYRDVRAGPFMQAYSPNEAYEYIGKVALGLPLQVDV